MLVLAGSKLARCVEKLFQQVMGQISGAERLACALRTLIQVNSEPSNDAEYE